MKCNLCNNQADTKITVERKGNKKILHLCKNCLPLYHSDVLQMSLISCGYCGTTLASIKCKNSFGCDKCYEEFQKQLKPLLQVLQQSDKTKSVAALKKEMEQCIILENYEQAAVLRDQIFALQNYSR